MNTHWEIGKLSDLVVFQRGFDITKTEQVAGNIPIISSSGITSYHNEAKQTGPAIIIGRKGTLGSVHYYSKEYWPHDTTLWSKELKGDPKFIFYFLKTMKLEQYDVGNANPTLNRNHIHKLDVPLPPLPTQQKIARILSAYDGLIENNLKRIKLLEEMAQLTYEEWFVRLKFPGHKQAVIDPESGLPDGWCYSQLQKHIKFIKGKKVTSSANVSFDGSAKIILLDSLASGTFKHTSPKGQINVKRGDIVMLMDGARSSWVFYTEKGVVGSTLAKVEVKGIPASILYQFFYSHIDWLIVNNTGAAIPHANKSFINKINFLLPDKQTIKNWNKLIDPINESVWTLKDQNQHLKEARDILLPRLMTGMIDVDMIQLPRNISGES